MSATKKKKILVKAAELFINPEKTAEVCHSYRRFILDIVDRANSLTEDETEGRWKFIYAFSVAVTVCPQLQSYAVEFLHKNGSFLPTPAQLTERKQHTLSTKQKQLAVEQSEAVWRFVRYFGHQISDVFSVDHLLAFLDHYRDMEQVVWLTADSIADLLCMSASQRDEFLATFFTDDVQLSKLKIRHNDWCQQMTMEKDTTSGKQEMVSSEILSSLEQTDLVDSVVMVAGILLPKLTVQEELLSKAGLVPVESMMNNLQSLALAVSSGSPVLLQGPVGSGKTCLVEHLAHVTGRHRSPHLMKIQLGDQTDSKALLGTYRCTDIPGEFTWQAGILTRAVREGHWVLLEDIDYAPMDVISVLLPLLERKTLSVPGHGDTLYAAPGFQLFATQRLLGSESGWHRQQSGSSVLLEKMWTKINVKPLTRVELQKVIITRFPQLNTVVDKLLDIYFMLSAAKHDLSTSMELVTSEVATQTRVETETVGKFLSHDGRLISTRDLMNWCSRIAKDFDVSATSTANLVLQEALDCFASCLPNLSKRILVAEAIGAKLNITKVMAEYFCVKYKPELKMTPTTLTSGRVQLDRVGRDTISLNRRHQSMFSFTRLSSAMLEKVAVCIARNEPVLLVGETGTGKTSCVQYLSHQLGHKLMVINMNQQSDSSDLLGGFKPVDMKHVIRPFREDFEVLFCETFSRSENIKFLGHLQECFARGNWTTMLSLVEHTVTPALKRCTTGKLSEDKHKAWQDIRCRLQQLKVQIKNAGNVLAFAFIEGTLVKALRNGNWVLLDEINLAAAETLECLSALLESTGGSVVLTERGDVESVIRHPDFRLFACMNPATDVGKKDLPIGIRNRFTEFYVDELEETQDLKILVSDYLSGLSLTPKHVDGIVKFYLVAKAEAAQHLTDGTGHKPHYSLRTLCRALKYAAGNPCGQTARSLYEGFCLSFLTQLDRASHPLVEGLVCQHIVGKANIKSMLKMELPMPSDGKFQNIEGYWVSMGTVVPSNQEKYIITPSVRENLRDLARVVSAGQHPVLIQGETSVGKTSLVTWLAQVTGNVCVRVNNHEHTDLQEYIGSYSADQHGKLVFKEGVLVEAMRKGYWVILDELNLAPTDVLEALNRLLDDNRELFIPETQETVRAHPKFMLFATQNPPGLYGGRKMLSRAFRNRFVELHFDQIPSKELETILHQRCDLPLSYARRLVAAMLDLQTRRRGSGVFAGKQGFMTLRDLFRWAQRYKCQTEAHTHSKFYDWDQHMADHGYMLLAGRVRKQEEAVLVQEVIQKHLKRSVDPDRLFTLSENTSPTTLTLLKEVTQQKVTDFGHIVWTYSMRRLAVLIGQSIQFDEPVLLVGDTGCGKTTICQLYAALNKTRLSSVNCHLHTESADFLGGLRPCRSHDNSEDRDKEQKLFEWVDGPLINSMRDGSMFLIDEISLADDSVLERLNSVLEPERTLLLAEKGGGDGGKNKVDVIVAKEGFQVFATMNPGGDFGKKELSPALRNRFTEIWCPQTDSVQDLTNIIEHNLKEGIHLCNQEDGTSGIGHAMLDFIHWFSNNDIGKRCTVSIRDILSWVHFINTCSKTVTDDVMETEVQPDSKLDPALSFIHGACLVFLDELGSGTTSRGQDSEVELVRQTSLNYLLQQVSHMTHQKYDQYSLELLDKVSDRHLSAVISTEDTFGVRPFEIKRGLEKSTQGDRYALQAPTTCVNAQRILRGLQLTRPLLLEGAPGVGKTSLVSAIAKAAGQKLVRINLSEQTDVTDLFGADLPVEGKEGGVFAWRDGPLLQALIAGHWVVLDELNLASQSVLEGLNACLDHRSEVYVPELGKTFHIQQDKTRLFACQNPLNQGGGRKGLPRSFLNRFTQVYVEPLTFVDLLFIAQTMYPGIPEDILKDMVTFNMQIYRETSVEGRWGQKGSPWEFNLRDLFRWCDLLLQNQSLEHLNPGEYVGLLYRDRMRSLPDKLQVAELYKKLFPADKPYYEPTHHVKVTKKFIQAGHSFLVCKGEGHYSEEINTTPYYLLHHSLAPMESVMKCVEMNWMSILVGPQSSGKTSLVQLLAQLSGHPLHVLAMNSSMDTTELLGGFEQADVSSHVDQICGDLKYIVNNVSVRLLQTQQLHQAQKLQRSWQGQKSKTDNIAAKLSSVEELQLLRDKASKLSEVVMVIKQIIQSQRQDFQGIQRKLEAVEMRLTETQTYLQTATPGSGGGAFEWVDSVLVHALEEGHWLLIDNVNFCSASVLDRLNALLEPNGVLSINERGVIDGCVPTIKPHPDFRLFLAMDPKFGEISRAMRNRGVEIYIPGEEDGSPYSIQDVKAMLRGQGLNNGAACDWLIDLHDDLRSHMSRGERPVILDLLHAALVTKQQLDRGTSLVRCLLQASSDVYVKSVKALVAKKIATDSWEDHCKKLLSLSTRSEDQLVYSPSTLEFSQDTEIANIKLHASVINSVLNSIITANSIEEVQNRLKYLWHAGTLFINMSSASNWQLHFDWILSYLGKEWKKIETRLSSERAQSVKLCFDLMCKAILNTRETYRSLGTLQDWECFTKSKDSSLGLDELRMIQSSPLDIRWNQQCLHRVFVKCHLTRHAQNTFFQLLNRVHVLDLVMKQMTLEEGQMSKLQNYVQEAVGRMNTHAELVELYHMFSMTTELLTAINSLSLQSYEDVTKILDMMSWRNKLLEASQNSLHTSDLDINTLSLYWNWFYSKAWSVIAESMSPSVHSVVNQIHSRLGQNNVLVKVFLKFWRAVGHPSPYKHQTEADVTLNLLELTKATDLGIESVGMVTSEKVKLLVEDGGEVRARILESLLLLGDLSSGNAEKINTKIQIIKEMLKNYELGKKHVQEEVETDQSEVNSGQINQSVSQTKSTWQHVQLWPLFGYTALLCELSVMPDIIQSGGLADGLQNKICCLTDFCLQFTPSSPSQIWQYRKLPVNTQAWSTVLPVFNELLKKLTTSPAVRHVDRWLQWTGAVGEEDEPHRKSQGCYAVHAASITNTVISVLCSSLAQTRDGMKLTQQLQPLQVALCDIETQKDKLGLLSMHLWAQAAVLSHQTFKPSVLERRNLLEVFLYFLKTAAVLVREGEKSSFTRAIEELSETAQREDIDRSEVQNNLDVCCQHLLTQLPHCQSLINTCFDLIGQVIGSRDLVKIGSSWVYLGLLYRSLLTPSVLTFDPVEKNSVKLHHCFQELEDVQVELQVNCEHHKLLTGQDLTTLQHDLLHPRIPYLVTRVTDLQKQIEDLKKQQAFRPKQSQFRYIVSAVQNYLSSIGSEDHTIGLLDKLISGMASMTTTNEFAEEKMWQKTHMLLLNKLENDYPHYGDILLPFTVAVRQVMHGIRLVAGTAQHHQEKQTLIGQMLTGDKFGKENVLRDRLVLMSKFPVITVACPSYLDLVKTLTSDLTAGMIQTIMCREGNEDGVLIQEKILFSSLMHACLDHARNDSLMRQELTSELTFVLSSLFHHFVCSWQRQEEEKRKKEEEEGSMYRYKSKVHGDDRDNDVIEEEEFKQKFPTFDKFFVDITGVDSLEESHVMEVDDDKEEFSKEEITPYRLTEEEMHHVYQSHHDIFTVLTKAHWQHRCAVPQIKSKDVVKPAMSTYLVAATLFSKSQDVLSCDVDSDIIGGHMLASYTTQEEISKTDLPDESSSATHYDIYHDPNVPEVIQCRPVLSQLLSRVLLLHTEWPDHPTLKQLIQIVERIQSFPVTSPVAKFLTGMELLLEKAQEWESNAAKHVSMATELNGLSGLIMNWRKLELSCWSQCLNSVWKKHELESSKWWFHLYQLIESYVLNQQDEETSSQQEVMQALKQFMEKSTLGDYHTRLGMLKAFQCQLVYMEQSERQAVLICYLHNLYQFYAQFSTLVHDELTRLKAPIQKELKGFVKIARWTDMNYWALKQTTDKTHRTLHKHMKAFQMVLEQSIQGILTETHGEAEQSTWMSEYSNAVTAPKFTVQSPLLSDDPLLRPHNDALPLQGRLPALCQRVCRHLKKYVNTAKYKDSLETVEEFTGDVIQTVHELRSMEVNQSAEKDKQRSEAKHIHQMKRKALADLFKHLALFGLSYRKGLVLLSADTNQDSTLLVPALEMSAILQALATSHCTCLSYRKGLVLLSADTNQDSTLLVPALEMSAILQALATSQGRKTMCSVWKGCRQYYYRCIGRRARFLSALLSPHQELGLGNIERCKGFTEHLLQFLVQTHTQMAETGLGYRKLCQTIAGLKKLAEGVGKPPLPMKEVTNWIGSLKDVIVTVLEGLAQFEILLQCCPLPSRGETPCPSPFPNEELSKMTTVKRGDEIWTNTLSIVQSLQKKAKAAQGVLLNMTETVWKWEDLDTVSEVVCHLQEMVPDISAVEMLFNLPGSDSTSALNDTLNFVRKLIMDKTAEFTNWKTSLQQTNVPSMHSIECEEHDIAVTIESLVEKLLIVVQTLVKSHTEQEGPIEDEGNTEESEENIEDGHYTKLLCGKLQQDTTVIECDKISSKVEELLHTGVENCSSIHRIVQCLPIIQQYTELVEHHLLQLLALHRTTGKLLSTLLGVFTDLASKGFCTPAEFADEVAGEGATDFEDIEGGGMGEGEGVKDVSDQIETEDQLEDAHKPGEKKEETGDQPDIPSEDNAVEMSEDFDGKLQDLEAADKKDDDGDESGDDEDKLDKQMGEVDEDDADKLDEQMWGSDEEGEEEKEETKEESGGGDGQEDESQLVAKDDNTNAGESDDKNQERKDKEENEDDREDVKPHQQEDIDESEYDEDKIDPYHNNKDQQEAPDKMELPDDLNLDENEDGTEDAQEGQVEDDAMEDDKQTQEVEEPGESTLDEDNQEEENEQPAENKEDESNKEMEEPKENTDSKDEDQGDDKENDKIEEDEGEDKPGFTAKDDAEEEKASNEEMDKESAEDPPQAAEHHGKTSHGVQDVEQSDTAQDQAGQSEENQEQSEGVGTSSIEQLEGHQGQNSSKVMQGASQDQNKPLKRKPGKSDVDRSLGSDEQKYKKLKTVNQPSTHDQNDADNREDKMESELYEHITDSTSHSDAQALDTATEEQQQTIPNKEMEEERSEVTDDDVQMEDEENEEEDQVTNKLSSQLKNKRQEFSDEGDEKTCDDAMETDENLKQKIPGEIVTMATVERGPESTIHTALENLHFDNTGGDLDIEKLRSELEEQLDRWSHTESSESEALAAEAWHRYEALTSSLSQDLCEQLRLVLEPSQAAKLKGDYRTGKRLNMRKVIPYIASKFRKDKIWLRRTKPSKRQYQVMLAVDDSSSMVDNHSKQLAYESLALISNALTLLESGELGICSFGEHVQVLHPMTEQFTSQCGARLLQHFSFKQKKTKIAQLLKHITSLMVDAKSRQHGMMGNPDTSQLLLIVSDGRGLFMEGMETVKTAVRQAREANIFLVFVIIDNPQCRDSILDIKVPVFKDGGMMPEIKSYMDHFPFPFYIILRDINSLPHVLCDALRQWFELVTAADR